MLTTHGPSGAPTQTQEVRASGDLDGGLLCECGYASSSLRSTTVTSGSTSLLTCFLLACVPFPRSHCFTKRVPSPAAGLITLTATWTGPRQTFQLLDFPDHVKKQDSTWPPTPSVSLALANSPTLLMQREKDSAQTRDGLPIQPEFHNSISFSLIFLSSYLILKARNIGYLRY